MNSRAARALTQLYSTTWRKRYGDELEGLLRDLPLSLAVVVDVVPRAVLTRPALLSATGALLVFLAALALQHHAPAREPVRIVSHVNVPDACRAYSSATRNGWIALQQCSD